VSFCTRCQVDVTPIGDFQPDGRVVECCPKCTSAVTVTVKVEPATPRPIAATEPARKRVQEPQDGSDILGTIRSRLEVAKSELGRLEKVAAEVAMLERMLAVAKETT
jgi:hypothetical protein